MAIERVTAAESGTSNSNLYVNIANQGTGTLTGSNVDTKLGKADRLLAFSEQMVREVNTAAETNLFSAGQIDASWVFIEILRTNASIYAQNSFLEGNNITPIDVYRVDTINGKYTVTEQIEYTNCIITKIEANAVSLEGKKLDTLKIWFRFTARTDTLYFFDQLGQAQGQNVSTVDFTKGTLQAASASSTAPAPAATTPAAGG